MFDQRVSDGASDDASNDGATNHAGTEEPHDAAGNGHADQTSRSDKRCVRQGRKLGTDRNYQSELGAEEDVSDKKTQDILDKIDDASQHTGELVGLAER